MADTDTALVRQMDDYILSFHKKRTVSTECYELYHQHFGS